MSNLSTLMARLSTPESARWMLRIAVAGEFIGHGVFALQQKAGWLKFFAVFGIGPDLANPLMLVIGFLDIILALMVLVCPVRPALLWMALWGFLTALIRPLSGDPIWDFVERWANWGAPLALWALMARTKGKK